MEYEFEPTNFERSWVLDSLEDFYAESFITSVLYRVKGGKEAMVYCCRAHPATELDLVAAKVYRPRGQRAMKNYSAYQEGRSLLGAGGKDVRDQRTMRAVKKKSNYGKETQTTSWTSYEYRTMGELYQAGADVPQPLNQSTNAILMDFIGDEDTAAPTLHEVSLEADEAQAFFTRIIGNIEVLLAHHMIHGDLSAYNILYWNGDFKIIDFPQVVDATHNSNALSMLARDVERVCHYFARFGVASHPEALTESLWNRYRRGEF